MSSPVHLIHLPIHRDPEPSEAHSAHWDFPSSDSCAHLPPVQNLEDPGEAMAGWRSVHPPVSPRSIDIDWIIGV